MNEPGVKKHIFLIAFYFILTLFMTYPVVFNINTHIAGDGGDGLQNVWNMWWSKKSLFGDANLYYTDYQFYPAGTSLTFHTLNIFNCMISIPLQLLFSLVTTYNIIFLLSFVLAGCGMFFLINYLVKDYRVALISGLAFAFCPYHFAHGYGHLQLISIQWIPFYLLFLIKSAKERKMTNPILAGIFLVITSLTSWYYMIFCFIFTIFYLIGIVLSEQKLPDIKFFKRFGLLSLIFGIIITPFVYPMIKDFFVADWMKMDTAFSLVEPSYYLLPNPLHPLFGKCFRPFYPVNLADSFVFLGYTLLAVSIIGAIKKFKKVKFWLILGFVFFLLSLDPKNGITQPLYLFFYNYFPFFSVISNTGRFSLMVLISVIVTASFGLKHILGMFKNKPKRQGPILFLVSFLILFEFISIPFLTTYLTQHDIFYEARLDEENYTILNVPTLYEGLPLYFQTIHEKKILGGYVSRTPPQVLTYLEGISKLDEKEEVYNAAKKYNIRYIVFDKHKTPKGIDLTNFINLLPKTNVYEDDYLVIYEVK